MSKHALSSAVSLLELSRDFPEVSEPPDQAASEQDFMRAQAPAEGQEKVIVLARTICIQRGVSALRNP